jgi:hypothetical protein
MIKSLAAKIKKKKNDSPMNILPNHNELIIAATRQKQPVIGPSHHVDASYVMIHLT